MPNFAPSQLLDIVPSQGTVSFWFSPNTTLPNAQADPRLLCKINDGAGGTNFFDCYLGGNSSQYAGKVACRIGRFGVTTTHTSHARVWAANAWYHVAFVWDGTNSKVYINGQLESSTTPGTPWGDGGGASVSIGQYISSGTPSNFFPGTVDEVKFASRAFLAADVLAEYNARSFLPTLPTESQMWVKYNTPVNPVVMTPSVAWEGTNLSEPRVLFESNTFKMWYRGHGNGNGGGLGYACSPDGINWAKHSINPIVGGVAQAAGVATNTFCPAIYKEGSTYYLYYTDGVTIPNGKIWCVTSQDGIAFGNPQVVANPQSWAISLANTFLYEEAGTYYLFVESQTTGGTWQLGVMTATSPLGPFEVQGGAFTQLQMATDAAVSGPCVRKIGSTYHLWYHAGFTNNLPSKICRATSATLLSGWTKIANNPVIDITENIFDTAVDQVADPCVIEVNGKCYCWYDCDTNVVPSNVQAKLCLATFEGTLAQLTANG